MRSCPSSRRKGANTIVLLLHQGGYLTPFDDRTCKVLNGPILPILDKLDPAISVVSPDTRTMRTSAKLPSAAAAEHGCSTSSSKYGTLLTNIRLRFSRRTHTLLSRSANFHVVQGEGFTIPSGTVATTKGCPVDRADPQVAAIVHRYADAARPFGERVVAHLAAPVSFQG